MLIRLFCFLVVFALLCFVNVSANANATANENANANGKCKVCFARACVI